MANNPQFTVMQPHPPRMIGHPGPPPGPPPSMPMQFRPAVPPPPTQQFVPQQFPQPVGHPNMGMPPHPMPMQFSQPVPPPPRPGPPLAIPSSDFQPGRPVMSIPVQPQSSQSFLPPFVGGGIPPSYHHAMPQTNIPNSSADERQWFPMGNQDMPSAMPLQQGGNQYASGQPWVASGNEGMKPLTPSKQNGEQNTGGQSWFPTENHNVMSNTPQMPGEQASAVVYPENITLPNRIENSSSDWIEHTSHTGKKYYHNLRTKFSSWEKPLELMTPVERADASTDWREITTREGRKFFYNKVTKISKWRMPDEVKLAREQIQTPAYEGTPIATGANTNASVSGFQTSVSGANDLADPPQEMEASPVTAVQQSGVTSGPLNVTLVENNAKMDATEVQTPSETVVSDATVPDAPANKAATPAKSPYDTSPQDATPSVDGTSTANMEKTAEVFGSDDATAAEEKKVAPVYETKEESMDAFKLLLESAKVESDWTWDQAMRAIINDRRYGALRTLAERKQAFNDFVGEKKRQEAEERRTRQKKAREDFKKMLEESKDLSSSTKWSKVISMFENDERFQAVERTKEREDLFEDYIEELKKKEQAKALEERKRNRMEYLEFLKSCDFITASSQWRKVQHRLEADERFSRLDKIESLEIFQEYIRDLEMEEEEQKKLQKEELRKTERKNRDEFRKLMDEHISNGILTVRTHWRDYSVKVKDSPAYLAVCSNTSGSSAKDLFADVVDDLEKQYLEDKERIEDAVKMDKILVSSASTFVDFKAAIFKAISSKISDVNLKIVFDDLVERAKEKEEKEAKKRKRLANDLHDYLYNLKEITASSRWEDYKRLVEERFIGEESFFKEIFDKVITELKEKAKEKERRRKEEKAKKEKDRKKEKERKDRDQGVESRKGRERHKRDGSDSDATGEKRRSRRDKDKEHSRWHMGSVDEMNLDDVEKDRTKSHRRSDETNFDDVEKDRSKSHRRSDDRKRLKQAQKHSLSSETESESQRKRHKRDHGSRNREHKHEESGEDGEVV